MILVSGATGFIGRRVVENLRSLGKNYRTLVRTSESDSSAIVADLIQPISLYPACEGVEQVIHCAGYAHAFSSLSENDSAEHWQTNFQGTRNLVEAAGRAGVKRFVFLSSVKAMGDPGDMMVDEDFSKEPEGAYGQSKRAAEQVVLDSGARYGMHVVNLRLAMAYGAGGRGNLERMGRLVRRGVFPPLPETGNHRSLVHVNDVVSAINLVANDGRASGKTYIVASAESPSGRALFDAMRTVQGLPPCRWSVPLTALRAGGALGDTLEAIFRRRFPVDSEVLNRLLGSAWYSSAKIERELGWRAQISLADGLLEMLRK